MAAPQQPSVEAQLQQLGQARELVMSDPTYWPQVLQGTLPIITSPVIEFRRWGADFLAETFSSPVVTTDAKQSLALQCLDTLLRLVEEPDAGILKSVVQCCASVYPMIFRYVCQNRNEADLWNKMSSLKSKILNLWDAAPVGVNLACIKFVQRVVLVQSRGTTDPRLVDKFDTSLGSVPAAHPLLSLPSLDAEAQGLLDRLLSILHEENSEPTVITATLNNLAVIIKTRPPLAPKVLMAVMNFNPFSGIGKPLTTQNRLMMLCMEKTVRILLMNILRSNPNGPHVGKISMHLQRLQQSKAELSEQISKKRGAAFQQDNDISKRAKTERPIAPQPVVTPIPTPPPPQVPTPTPPQPTQQVITGPMSLAQLFTLATDPAMALFDGTQLPLDMVVQIVLGSLYSIKPETLNTATAAIRDRYNAIQVKFAPLPSPATGQEIIKEDEVQLQLGEYRLPPPQPIPPEQLRQAAIDSIDRMFSIIENFEKISLINRKSKLGVNRLAASNWDREGWTSMIVRLPTRGIYADTQPFKTEDGEDKFSLADLIRERLFKYVTADFRGCMDIAVAWLNEEWYNDKVQAQTEEGKNREPQCEKWTMKVMDAIFPFLEAKDRLFMRMVAEIPEIPKGLLEKIKLLCLDPDRTHLGLNTFHYLASLRPPVREQCMDYLEDLYKTQPDLRKQIMKMLQKWRPTALAIEGSPDGTTTLTVPGSGTAAAITPTHEQVVSS
ncbi:hypothetical protein EX30DRAFT_341248 [Ascodesmis nigricans]|uniref:Symplekin/Pta1 N-terminal domain-containing protein n=1 Tax=Ascodesmis nigricans TaxID=341454 RepID=A0A4S2MWI8_9PEZI|nr:hypothetical protein EX30DRAFT_341248 [Ascodesmis nigricans]